MRKGLAAIALGLLLASAGCAARLEFARPQAPPPAPAPPEAAPRSKDVPAGSGRPAGTAEEPGAPAQAVPAPSTPAEKAASESAPSATSSVYVFSPQQAVTAGPGASAPAGAPAEPASPRSPDANSETARGELQLIVVASGPTIATGTIVTVDVMASSNVAVVDAPLHLSFDPAVVEFIDGAPGDFLTQGGSSIVFFADGRSRPGDVAVAAGRVERRQGAVGSGLLCRIRLRGVGRGSTPVVVGQAMAWGTQGEELAVATAGTHVLVD